MKIDWTSYWETLFGVIGMLGIAGFVFSLVAGLWHILLASGLFLIGLGVLIRNLKRSD